MINIKFRAWDTDKQEMAKVNFMNFNDYEVGLQDKECNTWKAAGHYTAYLMQYTGLKDEKGKEIYEGDIVEVDYPNYMEKFVITFCAGMFKAKRIDEDIENSGFSLCTITGERKCKIIGNIFENQELLAGII